jgi:3-oxoacyl-[acyl-carrier-protein] synthase-3
MAYEAAKVALERRGIDAGGLDAIIVCTVTPDMFFPSTACLVQHRLGAPHAWGFDLIAACSGFVYGLTTAAHLVGAGSHQRVMVIGADTMSRIIDYTDRATCVLFGDGAGAMIVEPAREGEDAGFIDFSNQIDGSGAPFLNMPAGGSRIPPSHETIDRKMHFVHQEGPQVFKYAVRKMYESCRELAKHNLTGDDVALFVPHQANIRIITAVADRLGLSPEKVMINIQRYGNTTAATIPLATEDAILEGKLKRGDLVLIAAVGAGFTVGSNLWRWAY